MDRPEIDTSSFESVPYDEEAPGGKTRRRLLDAAEKHFAVHGFESASIRQITREAGCNIAAVNYHFGSKERLYQEMFDRLLSELAHSRRVLLQRVLNDPSVTLERLLEDWARVFYEPLKKNATRAQWMCQLWIREVSEPRLPPRWMFDRFIAPVSQLFRRALIKVCPALDEVRAQMCIHAFVGHLVHIFHVLEMYRDVPVEESAYSDDLDQIIRHAVCYAAGGIRAIAQEAGS